MRYVKGFDTIRALAVFMVIVAHWGPSFAAGSAADNVLNSFLQYGRFGVIIFFVLSGFLITSILLKEKIRHGAEKRFTIIKNFFARRVLRIFPIYYLFILLFIILRDPFVSSHLGYFLTYTSNLLRDVPGDSLPHFWSLAVEEQFYIVWPWLILLVNNKYLKYVFIFFIIMGLGSQYLTNNVYKISYGVWSINCFDSFGIGAFYAFIRLSDIRRIQFERAFRIVLPLLLFIAWKMEPLKGLPISVIYYRFIDNLIALAMIMFALNTQTVWVKRLILENPVLNFIGKISYGIYLYHYSFGIFYNNAINYIIAKAPATGTVLGNSVFFYCSKLAILLFVCWLSFILIERPVMRLKKRFEYAKP
jgi:peptidoglycan/LPS O-acetylase OafA/YrhL